MAQTRIGGGQWRIIERSFTSTYVAYCSPNRSGFKTPNKEKTSCILPERFDVAMHQLLSGGIDARKESYRKSVSRLIVLQKY